LNFSTRWFAVSATHTLLEESAHSPFGSHIAVLLRPHFRVAKLLCPSTKAALVPNIAGVLKTSTREFPVSATKRLPLLSTATPRGAHRRLAAVPQSTEVELGCPKTKSGPAPLAKPTASCHPSTRLFWVSAT
jgi:hypothetical protein